MSTNFPAARCQECGAAIAASTGSRGGRPRRYCHLCRPSRTAARRAGVVPASWNNPCQQCGGPVERHRRSLGRPRVFCHTCRPDQPRPPRGENVGLDELPGENDSPAVRAVLDRLIELAHAAAWTEPVVRRRATELRALVTAADEGGPVRLSRVRAELGMKRSRIAARVLADCGMLIDDAEPRVRRWITARTSTLPEEVHAWLVSLADGEERARPRAEATLHAYLSRIQQPLTIWSQTRSHLREVTRADVLAALDDLTGHRRKGTFVALRSLFRFAKRRRLIFLDPTKHLRLGGGPDRTVLPLTDDQIAAVTATVVTPMQRVAVALAAVYAARATPIRQLLLDDIDLTGRRIRIAGTTHRLTDFTYTSVVSWMEFRHRRWPHTGNPHLLVTAETVIGTAPITAYCLTWHLGLLGIELEHIRADRVLHEALAVRADPLHLAHTFGLSDNTALVYAAIARSLMQRPAEAPATVKGAVRT